MSATTTVSLHEETKDELRHKKFDVRADTYDEAIARLIAFHDENAE